MRVIRLTDPAAEPVTTDEALLFCRNDVAAGSGEAAILTQEIMAMIRAAREHAENICSRPFVSATWAVLYDGDLPIEDDALFVPMPGVTAVTSVTYRDPDGASQSIAAEDYTFDAERQLMRPADAWPSGTDLRIAVTAGATGERPSVPRPVRQAILMLVADMFENREAFSAGETVTEHPAVRGMLQPYRERMGL